MQCNLNHLRKSQFAHMQSNLNTFYKQIPTLASTFQPDKRSTWFATVLRCTVRTHTHTHTTLVNTLIILSLSRSISTLFMFNFDYCYYLALFLFTLPYRSSKSNTVKRKKANNNNMVITVVIILFPFLQFASMPIYNYYIKQFNDQLKVARLNTFAFTHRRKHILRFYSFSDDEHTEDEKQKREEDKKPHSSIVQFVTL